MASRNHTLQLTEDDINRLMPRLLQIDKPVLPAQVAGRTLHQDTLTALPLLPDACADLVFADPPYNLVRSFGKESFRALPLADYRAYLNSWLPQLHRLLKPGGTLYLCGDWRSSAALHLALEDRFVVRNRITWEREKGRGASANWKNASEDIFFCTKGKPGDPYYFDLDSVKLKRKVIAPYRQDGQPKDWATGDDGKGYRLTAPSNLWTDISVPFWSMPENTPHPTQKPEKLLAKLLLASCPPGGLVLDPFCGSGTTCAVAAKLGRQFIGIDSDETWCLYTERRLELAAEHPGIQGYAEGVFWERNSAPPRH